MRLLPLLTFAIVAGASAIACGGGIDSGTGNPSPTKGDPKTSPSDPPSTITTPPSTTQPPSTISDCPNPATVLVASGGTLSRPAGSALRLTLVYQGAEIGIQAARGVDMILSPGDGPFTEGKISGYWFETDNASGMLYQRIFQDPTRLEAPGPPGTGGFSNSTIAKCTAKTILADVPNDPSATELRVYGSPYGTLDGAVLLGRFTLE